MRWQKKIWKVGDTIVIKRFLFFPRCIDGECRWLEVARIRQQLRRGYNRTYWSEHWDDNLTEEEHG